MAEFRDRWIAVGLDHQVQPGSSNPAIVEGQPLAIWRGESGAANVWEDRCPHRGMRLSFGFVRGNMLRCIYHGWGYEAGGQCALIPAHPELTPPKTICANVYPSAERYGILWTNLAKDTRSEPPELGPAHGWAPVRSVYVNRNAAAVAERLPEADCGIADASISINGHGAATIDAGPDLTLLVAIQPVSAERCGLHVVARGKAAETPDARAALARKMERLRGALEAR